MTVINIETKDRTETYEDGAFIQWKTGTSDPFVTKFVSAWNFTSSMDEWDIDRIDSAAPVFSKITDILGTFSFNIKNAVSLYDTATTPPAVANNNTLSAWIALIAIGQPPIVKFAPVMKGDKSTGLKFINLVFTGRVMDVPIDQVLDQGVLDVVISGEITAITTIQRSASANELS